MWSPQLAQLVGVDSAPVFDKVQGRVHMGPEVGDECEALKVVRVAADLEQCLDAGRAGHRLMGHPLVIGMGEVNPAWHRYNPSL